MIYSTKDLADESGCARITVVKWCEANGVAYIGRDKRKEYQISEDDRERFNARNTTRGRPSKKNV